MNGTRGRRGGASAAELATLRGELGERLARMEATLHAHTVSDAENFHSITETLAGIKAQVDSLVVSREVASAVAKAEARAAARGPAAAIAAAVGLLTLIAPKAAETLAAIFGG
jgi:aspartate ammonia-lyase